MTDCIQRRRVSRVGLIWILPGTSGQGDIDVGTAAFVEPEGTVLEARTHRLACVREISEAVHDFAGGSAGLRVTAADEADVTQQSHPRVHIQAEVRDIGGRHFLENFHQRRIDVGRELSRCFGRANRQRFVCGKAETTCAGFC